MERGAGVLAPKTQACALGAADSHVISMTDQGGMGGFPLRCMSSTGQIRDTQEAGGALAMELGDATKMHAASWAGAAGEHRTRALEKWHQL
jgi:hypothetical protein